MTKGECDKADPSLILSGPHIPRPMARAQGLDQYEGPQLNAQKLPEKAKG
jgi:hypothetical protein